MEDGVEEEEVEEMKGDVENRAEEKDVKEVEEK